MSLVLTFLAFGSLNLKVSREVFEAAKGRLKVVGRAGVGIDNVDLQAATEFGCLVVNAPTANTVAAAEHGIALLTAMARNVAQADASVKAGKSRHFNLASDLLFRGLVPNSCRKTSASRMGLLSYIKTGSARWS